MPVPDGEASRVASQVFVFGNRQPDPFRAGGAPALADEVSDGHDLAEPLVERFEPLVDLAEDRLVRRDLQLPAGQSVVLRSLGRVLDHRSHGSRNSVIALAYAGRSRSPRIEVEPAGVGSATITHSPCSHVLETGRGGVRA